MYDGSLDDECPVHGSAVSFKIGDYLHIFEKFDANWWVGRKVKENCDIGFIPSPDRLEQLILQKAPVGKLDRYIIRLLIKPKVQVKVQVKVQGTQNQVIHTLNHTYSQL